MPMTKENEAIFDYRHFSATVRSRTAMLYFLGREDLENFLCCHLPESVTQSEMETRMAFLQRQIDTVERVSAGESKKVDRQRYASKLLLPPKRSLQQRHSN